MRTSDLDYPLPDAAVAQRPVEPRDAARLLVDRGPTAPPDHRHVRDLPSLVGPGDLVVLNATRVLPARLRLRKATGGAAEVLLKAVAAGVLVILFLSIIDLNYQRYQHEKDLRMTKKEVKDEHKNTEGDPHVKARIRKVQRELATRRMMEDVPDATVVVTNPTHFAVALRYDRSETEAAPRVVAKGVDEVALRIREVARSAGVPAYEDRLLARALHARVDIGDVIPEELFQAVAKVLAYVYRQEGKTAHASPMQEA